MGRPRKNPVKVEDRPPAPEQEVPVNFPTGETTSGSVSMTPGELQTLMATMAKTIVEEMKKPTAAEQAKLDEQAALAERRRKEMLELGLAEEQATRQRQENCSHTKPNGQLAIGGQVYSDGVAREFCLRCQKVLREYQPGQEMVAQGFGNVSVAPGG